MDLIEAVTMLHHRNYGDIAKDAVSTIVEQEFGTNEIVLPNWLPVLFAAAVGKHLLLLKFPIEEYTDEVVHLLLSICGRLSWTYEYYGEWYRIDFPQDGLMIYISLEALDNEGCTCCSATVRKLLV